MTRVDKRNAIFCGLIATATFLIVGPFVEMPFNDDWSYAFSTKEFIRTGQLHYNGWGAPLLLTQVLWGSAFVRLFGFSFTVLRFSTLPFSVGSAVLSYLLARLAGLRASLAFFASMLLVLCPIYLPLATSYMTDVPGLFFILLSFWMFARASRSSSVIWLMLGVIVGFIGGLDRQSVWIVPLTALAYLGWINRRKIALAVASVVGLIFTIMASQYAVAWQNLRPYAIREQPLGDRLSEITRDPRPLWLPMLGYVLTTVLLVLPVALPVVVEVMRDLQRKRSGMGWICLAAAILFWGLNLYFRPILRIEPWLENILGFDGILSEIELPGAGPISQPIAIRHGFALLSIVVTGIFMAWIVAAILDRKVIQIFFQRVLHPTEYQSPVLPMMLLFTVVYSGLAISQAMHNRAFDRYTLPIIPCVGIVLLVAYQKFELKQPLPKAPIRAGILLMGLFGIYALAADQDVLALARARLVATRRLENRGIARTAIKAGLEFNFWTQLEQTGYINNPLIRLPTRSFHVGQGFIPDVVPLFKVERAPLAGAKTIDVIEYISWLPPFHRKIYVNEFASPVQD